jgi:phosphoribosyl 1,2-cyclic phosphate phosphodiesterase
MDLTILGSGGPLVTPRPGCGCRVCDHARLRGGDSRRLGPAIYVHDARLLIDAPGSAIGLLTRAGIEQVDHLFLSHWHPDHSEGFRFVEQLNYDLESGRARRCTDVWMNETTANRLAAEWRHFERRGYCQLHVVQPGETLDLGAVSATWFNYAEAGMLSGFLLTDARARVLVVVDETSGLHRRIEMEPSMQGCDLLIAECGWFERDPDGKQILSETNPHRDREAGFERDTLPLLLAARASRTVLTHLMDIHGHTPHELDKLAKRLPIPGVQFARDGLTLAV